jgi:hypothetical protein
MVSLLAIKNKIGKISIQSLNNPDLIISLLLFLSIFILYLKHLAPTIFTGDSADATIASYVLGIPHPPGFPVYVWIGHLFTFIPVGDIAYRVNLMSAFFGALTIPVVYMIIRLFASKSKDGFANFASRCGAIFGSMSLAFSIYYWANAEIAEVNTLNAFFLASMVILVLIWAEKRDIRLLYLLSLVFSLSVGISAANILFIPSFLAFLFLVDRNALLNKKTLIAMIGIFIAIGLLQMIFLYIRALQEPAYVYTDIRNINAFLNFITASEYSSIPFSLPLSHGMSIYFTYLIRNVSLVGIIIGVIGIALSLKRNMLWSAFLASLLAINIFFFVQYDSFDLYDKLIPSFMMFSIFIGLCVWEVLGFIKTPSYTQHALKTGKKGSKPALKTGKREYFFRLALIAMVLIIAAYVPLNSYTSNSQEVDRSGRIGLPYFLTHVLREVPANSTIIDVWQITQPLKYFQIVYNMNPTVEILGANYADWPDRIQERINRSDVFLLRENQNLSDKYSGIPVLNLNRVGTLYEVYSGYPSFSVIDPAIQHPVNKLWDGKIELIGYDLNQSKEKDGFSLTYYWQSKENVSNDYVIYLDLIDQHGSVVLEDIHTPIYGIFPTSRWMKNEVLKERYNIIYPPSIEPGTYELFMSGKWKMDSSGTTDRILLGNIEVGKIDLDNTLTRYHSDI